MKVVVERSGGFAGIKRRGEREGDALTLGQRDGLRRIMDATPSPPNPGADQFTYRVEVQDGGASRSVSVPESAMPPDLAAIATD